MPHARAAGAPLPALVAQQWRHNTAAARQSPPQQAGRGGAMMRRPPFTTALFLLLSMWLPLSHAEQTEGDELTVIDADSLDHMKKSVPQLKLDFGSAKPPEEEALEAESAVSSASGSVPAAPEPEGADLVDAASTGDPLGTAPRAPAFWDLIAPVPEAAFFEEYWNKRPLHVARGKDKPGTGETKKRISSQAPAPKEFEDLLSVSTVDHLLRGSPTLQMYMRGSGLAVQREGFIPVLALWEGVVPMRLGSKGGPPSVNAIYTAGHTVLVENAELWWEPYTHLCRALGAYFDYGFKVELLLTPAGRPILAPQSSANDAFVIQTGGAADWKLAPPSNVSAPYERHEFAPNSDEALKSLAQREVVFSTRVEAGEVLFVPRGWTFTASCSDAAHSHIVRVVADSQRFSHGGFVQALLGTLTKTVTAEFADADEASKSAFTATQATALTDGLVATFVEEALAEVDQSWLRQPLPIGVSNGDGMGSLVGGIRTTLTQLRSYMRELAPKCDAGTNGCPGAIDTLLGNMPMLTGLVKYVWQSLFSTQLRERADMLRSQSMQQRRWKAEAQQLLRSQACAALLKVESATEPAAAAAAEEGGSNIVVGKSGEHSHNSLSTMSMLKREGTAAAGKTEAVEGLSPVAQRFLDQQDDAGIASFEVSSIPSDTDDDLYRVSLAAQLLDGGFVTLLGGGAQQGQGKGQGQGQQLAVTAEECRRSAAAAAAEAAEATGDTDAAKQEL